MLIVERQYQNPVESLGQVCTVLVAHGDPMSLLHGRCYGRCFILEDSSPERQGQVFLIVCTTPV